MRELLRPKATTLVLFALFVLIAAGGYFQAGKFALDEQPARGTGGILMRAPLWELWVLLGAPVHLLFVWMDDLGDQFARSTAWTSVYLIIQLIYFYLLASLISAFAQSLTRRLRHGAAR